MNIFAPIRSYEDASALIDIGVDELYCGVIPDEWTDDYNDIKSPNRRVSPSSQVGSVSELSEISYLCYKTDTALYITLNSHFYSESQYKMLESLIEQLNDFEGISGLIVADVPFLSKVATQFDDLEIIVSTGGTTFNSETASFYREMGVDGIHLPRHLTVNEISHMVDTVGDELNLYAFVLNENCTNIDGHCTFLHDPPVNLAGVERAPCIETFEVSPLDGGDAYEKRQASRLYPEIHRYPSEACGLCSMFEFEEAGLHGVKIVGRAKPVDVKVVDTKVVNDALEYVEQCSSDAEYMERVKNLISATERRCDENACYYPSAGLS